MLLEICTGYLRSWLLLGRGPGVLGGWQTLLHYTPFYLPELYTVHVIPQQRGAWVLEVDLDLSPALSHGSCPS